jgi:hypothetical protein
MKEGINRDGQDRQDERHFGFWILDFGLEISSQLYQLCFYPVYPVHPCYFLPSLLIAIYL